MPRKNTAITVHYLAYDASGPKTGDAANHALRIIADGTIGTLAASPAEVDATNAPGIYKVVIAADENTGAIVTLAGKSSTSGVSIAPLTWTNESNAAQIGDTNQTGADVGACVDSGKVAATVASGDSADAFNALPMLLATRKSGTIDETVLGVFQPVAISNGYPYWVGADGDGYLARDPISGHWQLAGVEGLYETQNNVPIPVCGLPYIDGNDPGNVVLVSVFSRSYALTSDGADIATLANQESQGTAALATSAQAVAIAAKTDLIPASPAATGDIPSASAVATAVWGYSTRTLSSFGTLVTSIVTAVWSAATRTLTGAGGGTGPTASTNAARISMQVLRGRTPRLSAKVFTDAGAWLTQAAFTSATYRIYVEATDEELVASTDCTSDVLIYDTMQTDAIATDFNFRHEPRDNVFTTKGQNLIVAYTITTSDGETFGVEFDVAVR
jgi:hypothetical protein